MDRRSLYGSCYVRCHERFAFFLNPFAAPSPVRSDAQSDKKVAGILPATCRRNTMDTSTLSVTLPTHPDLLARRWPAAWCQHPDGPRHDSAVYLFRKVLTLSTVPDRCIVHVTADQRYRLLVNGTGVCWGPARGDTEHWRYETVDIAPYLTAGENVLGAVVHYMDDVIAPMAQITSQAGFLMQSDSDADVGVNTPTGWRVWRDTSVSFSEEDARALWTYAVVGPSEHRDCRVHPWEWDRPGFDDEGWGEARVIGRPYAAPYGIEDGESPWWLVPRSIPLMEEAPTEIGRIVRAEGVALPDGWPSGGRPLTIPPRTRAVILFDRGFETCVFPEISVSGGRDTRVRLAYAEALVDGSLKPNDPQRKGNRNETKGRVLRGFADYWTLDGGDDRLLRPLWWKTYRYAELTVETEEEPAAVDGIIGIYTGYPFVEKARFNAPELPDAAKIGEVGWRTIRLCAHETYMDCPYYEQLQYVGDTRIQCLISQYVSGDHRLFRNALSLLNDSRLPDGLTQSRYPSRLRQVIPPFSLWWVCMIHDYCQLVPDDEPFMRSLLPGVRGVIGWFRDRLRPNGLLGPLEWWCFADWCRDWRFGVPPGAVEGGSSILTLQYVLALFDASRILSCCDESELHSPQRRRVAQETSELASEGLAIVQAVRKLCFDRKTMRVADTPEKKTFSQHAAILAVLTDAVPEKYQQAVMERVLTDPELSQATFYFRFYLNRALVKAGLGDRYWETLGPWRDMLAMGLTTWAENPEPTRSDCHAWSASPNYEFLATILGILPGAPGFAHVRLEPHLGPLTEASGSIPHPKGEVVVSYQRAGKTLTADIALPEGVTGRLVWRGHGVALTGGRQRVTV
jgi:alpha-L-rhamnosidase